MGYPRQARLGDVTTPGTGSGPGLFSQIWGWITASPANAANSPVLVQQWMAQVRARGNAVVRYPFPSDDVAQNGDLVERMDAGDSYNYIPAPLDVVNADRITRGLSTLAPITARVAEVGENIGKGLEAPIVKGAIIVGGIILAANVLPSLLRKR